MKTEAVCMVLTGLRNSFHSCNVSCTIIATLMHFHNHKMHDND